MLPVAGGIYFYGELLRYPPVSMSSYVSIMIEMLIYGCKHIHTCINTYIYTYIYIHIYVYIYIYVHIYVNNDSYTEDYFLIQMYLFYVSQLLLCIFIFTCI
jgi:hypothetical protein